MGLLLQLEREGALPLRVSAGHFDDEYYLATDYGPGSASPFVMVNKKNIKELYEYVYGEEPAASRAVELSVSPVTDDWGESYGGSTGSDLSNNGTGW